MAQRSWKCRARAPAILIVSRASMAACRFFPAALPTSATGQGQERKSATESDPESDQGPKLLGGLAGQATPPSFPQQPRVWSRNLFGVKVHAVLLCAFRRHEVPATLIKVVLALSKSSKGFQTSHEQLWMDQTFDASYHVLSYLLRSSGAQQVSRVPPLLVQGMPWSRQRPRGRARTRTRTRVPGLRNRREFMGGDSIRKDCNCSLLLAQGSSMLLR